MDNFSVLVVILNYHGETVLMPCLESLVPTLGPMDKLLIIDNGHEGVLMERVRERFPTIKIEVPDTNLGFARGVNIGLNQALKLGYDAVWLVNNDALVKHDTLLALKRVARMRKGLCLLSPMIFGSDGQVWFAGGEIDYWCMRTKHLTQLPDGSQPFGTEFLTGCALFIPRQTLEAIGLFDERYFLYYEDADYSVRVRERGGQLWIVPEAVVLHHEASQMNPDKLYFLVKSGIQFFFDHTSGYRHAWVRLYTGLRRVKNKLRLLFSHDPVARKLEQAYTDAFKAL